MYSPVFLYLDYATPKMKTCANFSACRRLAQPYWKFCNRCFDRRVYPTIERVVKLFNCPSDCLTLFLWIVSGRAVTTRLSALPRFPSELRRKIWAYVDVCNHGCGRSVRKCCFHRTWCSNALVHFEESGDNEELEWVRCSKCFELLKWLHYFKVRNGSLPTLKYDPKRSCSSCDEKRGIHRTVLDSENQRPRYWVHRDGYR